MDGLYNPTPLFGKLCSMQVVLVMLEHRVNKLCNLQVILLLIWWCHWKLFLYIQSQTASFREGLVCIQSQDWVAWHGNWTFLINTFQDSVKKENVMLMLQGKNQTCNDAPSTYAFPAPFGNYWIASWRGEEEEAKVFHWSTLLGSLSDGHDGIFFFTTSTFSYTLCIFILLVYHSRTQSDIDKRIAKTRSCFLSVLQRSKRTSHIWRA